MYTLCLPKIDNTVTKSQLYLIFNKYNFGNIYKIDLININQSKRAFIHYNTWNKNEKNNKVKKYLDDGLDIKVIYEFPWFWKCSKSRS
jgi:hypothetical protein